MGQCIHINGMWVNHSNIINISEALIGESLDIPDDVVRLRRKAGEYGLDIQQLDRFKKEEFDGVLSNFGGLNCIEDWQIFAQNSLKA